MNDPLVIYCNAGTRRIVKLRCPHRNRTLRMEQIARVDNIVLGRSPRGTPYLMEDRLSRVLRHPNSHTRRCVVQCLALLGLITDEELKLTTAVIDRASRLHRTSIDRNHFLSGAQALGIKLNKTQLRKAGAL